MTPSPYVDPPIEATALQDCYFYHTTDVPGHGLVKGEWDLAPGIRDYLGGVAFDGRTVLDVGAATGFLTFHMEREGAHVTAFDLSPAESWDIVPLSRLDADEHARVRRHHIGAINNGFWFCHRAFDSRARMAHGTVYKIPMDLGPVDVSVFGSILLHLRDPFHALHNAARLTRDTMIVAEILPGNHLFSRWTSLRLGAAQQFKPRFRRGAPWETWWNLPPALIKQFLGVLGFEKTVVTFHTQRLGGRRMPMYTVVATRTHPTVPLESDGRP